MIQDMYNYEERRRFLLENPDFEGENPYYDGDAHTLQDPPEVIEALRQQLEL